MPYVQEAPFCSFVDLRGVKMVKLATSRDGRSRLKNPTFFEQMLRTLLQHATRAYLQREGVARSQDAASNQATEL